MDDWANSLSADNCPNEERKTCRGYKVGLDREKMSNLLDWEPDSWKRSEPEEEERNKIDCVGA
jgi:hypothetical protein